MADAGTADELAIEIDGLRNSYGGAVLIAVLLISETTVEKLASHHISPEEVRQVSDGDRIGLMRKLTR